VSIDGIAQEIIQVCQRIYQRGYAAANDGNVSARLDDRRVVITPTGRSKGFLGEEELVLCDMQGHKLSGAGDPSSELAMHLMVYQEREDIYGVVHAHPPTATGFAVAGIPLEQRILPEATVVLGDIPIVEYGTPSTKEVPDALRKYIHRHNAFLLANHGALTLGSTALEAYHRMEVLEHFSHISLVVRQLGKMNVLSDEQVQKLMRLHR
jgi:L-fuculose-phosphate aldolase